MAKSQRPVVMDKLSSSVRCTQYGNLNKWPSRMQGQWLFGSRVGQTKVFGRVHKISISLWGVALAYIYLPQKARRGRFNVHLLGTPHTVVFISGIYTI